ncbi:MAG: ABC transporter ATP-binding protein [Coprobacillus sp.]
MLKLTNVKKVYDQFTLNCSIEVAPGCVTGLIGQNGAGKSTTFKAILDLISIDSGNIEIFNKSYKDITKKDREHIGAVLSDSGFNDYLCVRDIVPIMSHMYKTFSKEDFLQKCHQFSLPTDKLIKDFSTGMKAKLKVLVAMSHQSKLLILDEPTAGLDVIARDELLDMLRNYLEENEDCSILISSHISSDLETLCDDVYMINQGQIVMHEDTDVLLSEYVVLKVEKDQFDTLDKQYILRFKKESYGYECLTNQKQFYAENYPNVVMEKGSIDNIIMLMIRGEEL